MAKHLHRDLELLTREILAMGSLVEEAMRDALEALFERRMEAAQRAIDGDDRIDQKEIEIEEECLKVLALHQPVAADLRFIVSVLKVNNDLERIADNAQNIASRAKSFVKERVSEPPPEIRVLAEKARGMVTRSLDALVKRDAETARAVCQDDVEIDRIHKNMFITMQERMKKDPRSISAGIGILSVSRYLERIADLATNIAEDVVFMVEGEIIRHGGPREARSAEPAEGGRNLRIVSES
jgi:phosphate transport system protein